MSTEPIAPTTNRQHLQQIISGLIEGVMLIEPDKSIAWANQTALDMHGVQTLEELGKTADGYGEKFMLKYRNNHRLSCAQYPIERVLSGDEFADVVVEVTRADDADFRRIHQVSGLILNDEAKNPEAAVLVMHDVTERYNAEERFEKTFNANPAPALICCLADLRYVRVNQGFLDMTGYRREKVIGRSVYEIDVLAYADKKDEAIASLNEGKTIPQMEAKLKLPGGKEKSVIVAGQPMEEGDRDCMLFTFIDLDPRKQVENELRGMQERFSKAFRLAPVPMFLSTLEKFHLLEVNDAFLNTTGYSAEETLNHDSADLSIWADAREYQKLEALLIKTNSVRNHEIQLQTKEGTLLDCLASAETVSIQEKPCVLFVIQNITERRQSEVELIAAIETVMQDTSWFSRTVIEKLAQIRRPQGRQDNALELADLTPREHDVLGLMCQGQSDEEIGATLHLARNTVRNHVATIYSKIDVHRRSAAIVWARERGIIGYEEFSHGKKNRTK
ncbi:MAG TPA: helix-turn-helix transcriptional regulator [Eoetvoesiella sp.]|jgi:PAS domain S-box-containing protein|uniref:helix-turn-helix transcriptional regulator n=1 Tax=Eoetvoesiella sp. TaxID=1966355 RepID=UPI002CD92B5A|nr:helix-turn-helix transcriptional regulator [Eoetvoesiella sp.]HWK60543.1 helix-turn-helix transcriptional regulator [Eoetvoesiella sp.]